jgi:hypothetical protein
VSRIRSIHPGLGTDDAYMGLSHVAARILPLLWCECDDQGVFEWKPRTLKAKLLPAHSDDMVEVLKELEEGGFLVHFEAEKKHYGAVRNFRRFQRPKFPKVVYPMPEGFRRYVGLDDAYTVAAADDDEPLRKSTELNSLDSSNTPPSTAPPSVVVPRNVEINPQMEEVGGRRKEDSEAKASAPKGPLDLKRELWLVGKAFLGKHGIPERNAGSLLGAWRRDYGDSSVLSALSTAEAECPGDVVEFIVACLQRAAGQRKNGAAARVIEKKPKAVAAGSAEWLEAMKEAGA